MKNQFLKGKITHREFLRNSTLLGLSAAAAYAFISPFSATKAKAATIKRGGTWKSAMRLQRLDHPARLSWTEGANVVRQVAEHLTESGSDNVTRPRLCGKWVASADVKTWDLYLRKGVKFNNGDVMTADDVLFTMGEWFNKDVGSSMLGLLSYWGGMQNFEKVNDYHIRVHLEHANIGVPEHLFHYPGFILHRGFEGDFIKQPVGVEAIDAHVSPAHSEYCVKPIPPYDPKGARALLEEYAKEKGLKLPLKVKLRQAEKTLDVEKRRAIFCDLEQIMQDRGPVAIPYWRKMFSLCNAKFENIETHPSSMDIFTREMWKNG